MSELLLESVLVCPVCGFAKRETMPTDSCQFFYECISCKTLLRPKIRRLLCLLFLWVGKVSPNARREFHLLNSSVTFALFPGQSSLPKRFIVRLISASVSEGLAHFKQSDSTKELRHSEVTDAD